MKGQIYAFRNNYGVDLGSSSVKVYSFFRNKTYIEKTWLPTGGVESLLLEMRPMKCLKITFGYFCRFSHGFWNACESRITGNRTLQHVEKDRSYIRPWCGYVFSVPLDMTAIEKRAYYHLVNGHWLRKNRVFMVESPIADAVAMNINLEKMKAVWL